MDSAFAPDGGNLSYIESLYQSFLDDPESVPEEWKIIFQTESSRQLNQATLRQHQIAKERATIKAKLQTSQDEGNEQIEKQDKKDEEEHLEIDCEVISYGGVKYLLDKKNNIYSYPDENEQYFFVGKKVNDYIKFDKRYKDMIDSK